MYAGILTFVVQQFILSVFALSSATAMPEDGNLIFRLGELFDEAVRELTQEQSKPVARVAPARQMLVEGGQQPKMFPGEADKKEHADRIDALCGAVQSWVTDICQLDEVQQQKLKDLGENSIAAENDRYGKVNDPARQNKPFGESTPILFVQPGASGAKFSDSLLKAVQKEILNEEQEQKLREALDEREQFHLAAFREFVVALFDQELFLTDDQREKMLAQLSESKREINSPFYSFIAQTYYLPYKPLGGLLSTNQATYLDERQKLRLTDLGGSGNNGSRNYIMFQSSEGPEQWEENIRQAIVTQRNTFLHAAGVRIGYFERSLSLTPEQVEYLAVASKGATVTALADWKESTQQTIDRMKEQMAQIQGNFAFSAQNISVDSIDSNAIWTDAVKQFDAEQHGAVRAARINEAKAKTVAALFDQEMWLTRSQREQITQLAERSLPGKVIRNQYDDYVRELILIAYPLHKSNEAEVHELLSESQRIVWKQLKEFLRMNRGNNYLEIPMKNQGGSFTVPLMD